MEIKKFICLKLTIQEIPHKKIQCPEGFFLWGFGWTPRCPAGFKTVIPCNCPNQELMKDVVPVHLCSPSLANFQEAAMSAEDALAELN